MAKKAGVPRGAKSAYIKEQLALGKMPKEIAESAKGKELGITAGFASNIKSTSKNKKGKSKGKRGRKPGIKAAPRAAAGSTLELALEFIEAAGGITVAKEAIDRLAAIGK
jgi:hypothetical protein